MIYIQYTHLGCFGARGEAGGSGRAFGNVSQMSMFQIRQALPGWAQFCCWAHWGWFFILELLHLSNYNVLYHFLCIQGGKNGWMVMGLDVIPILAQITILYICLHAFIFH